MDPVELVLLPASLTFSVTPVFVSRGKEFGHDVDIIFTTLELGKEEDLLLDVVKRLEKQVRVKDRFCLFQEVANGSVTPSFARDGWRNMAFVAHVKGKTTGLVGFVTFS